MISPQQEGFLNKSYFNNLPQLENRLSEFRAGNEKKIRAL